MDEARQGTTDKLIRNVFRYMDKNARDIMTHRKNIVAIDEEESLEDALHFMLETNYSRFPIYRESIDEIIGFMHLREAMTCYLKNNYRNVPVKELHSYIRPVDFIPESKNIDRLFKEMQAKKNHIVIVMDEYGQTSGLVTLEDILEEIVGNIMDEHGRRKKESIIVLSCQFLYRQSAVCWSWKNWETFACYIGRRRESGKRSMALRIDKLERIPNEGEGALRQYIRTTDLPFWK
ncbi:MAG: CBS domain-containing protein [Dorea sp.]